jgi:hypothetical protein
MKLRSARTMATATAVTALTGALLVGGASESGAAAGKAPGGQAIIAWTADLTYTPGRAKPAISTTDVGIWNVNADGEALGDRASVPATLTAARAIRNAVACRAAGKPAKGVQVFAPYSYSMTTPYGSFALASLFAHAGTRTNSDVQGTDQWGGCLAAGGVAATGYRLMQAGGGMATANSPALDKLGQDWAFGPAPATYTRGTVFPSWSKTGLAATIRQQPGGQRMGSFAAPSEVGAMNAHIHNAAFTWWQDPCTGEGQCTATSGSTGFQGATATALWGLDSGSPGHYVITGFLRIACPARCI